jgi:UPF0755 protein
MRNSNKRNVSCLRVLLVFILVILCLVLLTGVGLVDRVPKEAARRFGPSGPALDTYQRVVYSLRLLAESPALTTPVDPQGTQRTFTITLGESVNSISTHLQSEGLISSAEAFRDYLVYAGLDTTVQAGKYQLSPSMTSIQIAHKLLDPMPEDVEFNILQGWRAEEIADSLPTSGIRVDPAEFLALVRKPPTDLLPQGAPHATSLEGFLSPGTYIIKRETSAHDLLVIFLNRFDENMTSELRDAYAAHGLDLLQAVTLASIVQRESIIIDEQPTIVSVFYNRLSSGMKLESDPTVQYALGYQLDKKTWWKNPLATTDLGIDSRYNTYVYPGLPPGPIDSPGADALLAVAYPAQTNFYFFRAKCDGSGRHFFAETYQQHLNNACP